jgi:tetratricopeptide (TPR) repeat protein
MNFLLYMLGRVRRPPAGLRPAPRQLLLIQAAAHAAHAHWADALALYRRLEQVSNYTPMDLLIRGHLALLSAEAQTASRDWSIAIERLWWADAPQDDLEKPDAVHSADDSILDTWFREAQGQLRAGRFVRSADLLDRARARIEVLLSAHAGLMLLDDHPVDSRAASACAKLVHLADLALRFNARIRLAGQLADSLRERCLRADLAGWATTSRDVAGLLEAEFLRLESLAASLPGHAETLYRLALAARITGRLERSADAFRRVLAIHPHHVSSAIRLTITLLELGRPQEALRPLAAAFIVPAATMQTFNTLAAAPRDAHAFDRFVTVWTDAQPNDPAITRGNLAFALSELALLDEARLPWRDPQPA